MSYICHTCSYQSHALWSNDLDLGLHQYIHEVTSDDLTTFAKEVKLAAQFH